MTMTESNPKLTNGYATDTRIALADQVVLSGAGLASQGITNARRMAVGAVNALDVLALGAFDIADKLVDSNLFTEVATKGVSVARQTWTIGMDSGRDALSDL